jgi:cell division septum initiation protein DivIVA
MLEIQVFPLAQRDLILSQIDKQIKAKKELLITKHKELQKKQEVNDFLDNVKNDYNRYYNYIVREKEKQLKAMNMLKEYLDDLINSEQLVNTQLKMAKLDQRQILEEMDKIKSELDELVSS